MFSPNNQCNLEVPLQRIAVYRLEHAASKLGPFQHRGQLASIMNKGIYANASVMDDLDYKPAVAAALVDKRVRFAFGSQHALDRMIRDRPLLTRKGFLEVQLLVHPDDIVYHNAHDDQIVFIDRREKFTPTRIEWQRGAKAKALCQQALDHRLHCPQRVFKHFFTQMSEAYNSRVMSRWVCALAYDKDTPIGVLFGHSYWMGVYVAHDYRRLGVGRSLVEHTLEHLPQVISFTDDPKALRFFDAVGVPPG